MTVPKEDLIAILTDIEGLIAEGWTQDVHWDDRGAYCLVGAIAEAVGMAHTSDRDIDLVLEAEEAHLIADLLNEQLPDSFQRGELPYQRLICWNDDYDRIPSEVIEAVRRARASISQQEDPS